MEDKAQCDFELTYAMSILNNLQLLKNECQRINEYESELRCYDLSSLQSVRSVKWEVRGLNQNQVRLKT